MVPIINNTPQKDNQDKQNIFYLKIKKKTDITVEAQGQKTRDGFVVLKGSYITKEDMKGIPEKIQKLRKSAKIDEKRILQEDILFNSPSYAAAFVIGTNANGLTAWKTKDGTTLKDIMSKM